MKNYSDYHAQAQETLKNHWGIVALMQALLIIISVLISGSGAIVEFYPQYQTLSAFSSLGSFLVLPLQVVFYNVLLRAVRHSDGNWWDNAWEIIRKQYGKFLLAELVRIIILVVVSIFTLLIGGIILAYAYAMVPYLLHDYPELSIREAMKISREMMRGHKWELFILDLSFIGWFILGILTFGIGILFAQPYQRTARAAFYDDLRAEKLVEEADNTQETIEA